MLGTKDLPMVVRDTVGQGDAFGEAKAKIRNLSAKVEKFGSCEIGRNDDPWMRTCTRGS